MLLRLSGVVALLADIYMPSLVPRSTCLDSLPLACVSWVAYGLGLPHHDFNNCSCSHAAMTAGQTMAVYGLVAGVHIVVRHLIASSRVACSHCALPSLLGLWVAEWKPVAHAVSSGGMRQDTCGHYHALTQTWTMLDMQTSNQTQAKCIVRPVCEATLDPAVYAINNTSPLICAQCSMRLAVTRPAAHNTRECHATETCGMVGIWCHCKRTHNTLMQHKTQVMTPLLAFLSSHGCA
jgi:hypothetical protein